MNSENESSRCSKTITHHTIFNRGPLRSIVYDQLNPPLEIKKKILLQTVKPEISLSHETRNHERKQTALETHRGDGAYAGRRRPAAASGGRRVRGRHTERPPEHPRPLQLRRAAATPTEPVELGSPHRRRHHRSRSRGLGSRFSPGEEGEESVEASGIFRACGALRSVGVEGL